MLAAHIPAIEHSGEARDLTMRLKLPMEGPLHEWASYKDGNQFFAHFAFEGPLSGPGWAISSLGWALWSLKLALTDPTLTIRSF